MAIIGGYINNCPEKMTVFRKYFNMISVSAVFADFCDHKDIMKKILCLS